MATRIALPADVAEAAAPIKAAAPATWMFFSLMGSRAYGFAGPDSDYDWAGVYYAPTREVLSVRGLGRETHVGNEPDYTFHEVGKFLRLAVKGNPSVLEVLWSPHKVFPASGRICANAWADAVIEVRKSLLWKGSLKPYFGYYDS